MADPPDGVGDACSEDWAVSDPNITSGEWFVTHDAACPSELAIDTVIDGRTYHIALVHGGAPPNDLSIVANANVMSAAPALLEALQAYVDEAETHLMKGQPGSPFAMRLAAGRAAIAKATGRL